MLALFNLVPGVALLRLRLRAGRDSHDRFEFTTPKSKINSDTLCRYLFCSRTWTASELFCVKLVDKVIEIENPRLLSQPPQSYLYGVYNRVLFLVYE